MQFKIRSSQEEYLDNKDIPVGDLYRNLHELDVINTYLGGYQVSLRGLRQILASRKDIHNILDIGFGGGDSIKQMARYAQKLKRQLFFYGVDLKQDCLTYAAKNLSELKNKQLICDDYKNIPPELLCKVDIIHCSLFLHHLTDEEIIELFKFCKEHGCVVLANDLHRNWLAYYSIKFLTALFSKSWLVKNDACLSVLRAFKKRELLTLLKRAGFKNYSVKWSWAFRYILIAYE